MTDSAAPLHATLVKFGAPHTILHEGEHWFVLVRPAQPTLGSLILCARSDSIRAYGDLPPEAFAEQGQLVARIERLLREFVQPERINYLMLMMVDPHVHFHVLPRYSGERTWNGETIRDSGWPSLPDLATSRAADDGLIKTLRSNWMTNE